MKIMIHRCDGVDLVVEAAWSTGDGRPHREQFATRAAAIKTVAQE